MLKPAEQAPGCAFVLVRALREAGVPPDALALLPGEGEVGAALVRDPRVHTIAFTGSSPVGQEIVAAPPRRRPAQKHLKRVIAEMGGKNCVIVDADADLDEVVPALVKSAFVYAGQKCSAAARVLVPRGDPRRARRAARRRRRGARGRPGGAARHRRPAGDRARAPRSGSRATPPRRSAPAGSRAARARSRPRLVRHARGRRRPAADSPVLHEEIFGPLLAVERVRDVEEACDRVDASPFGLTGGLFARNPDTVDYVVDRSPVGNLYVNRAITGRDGRPPAVRRQPALRHRHEGRRPGYLLQFVEPRVVTENTVRHGLLGAYEGRPPRRPDDLALPPLA